MSQTERAHSGEVASLLVNGETISNDYGILVLCRIGNLPPHAFVGFEYLSPVVNGEMERIIKRLDFRPESKVYCVIGKGKITQDDVKDIDVTRLESGPFWRLKTEDVLQVPGFRNYPRINEGTEAENATQCHVTDMDHQVYSSAGNSLNPFVSLFKRKVHNCMTFSRGFLVKYREDLGITQTEAELDKMMNLKWVPVQLPNLLIPLYKKHQCQ